MREALGWNVTAPLMSELGWSIESQTEVLLRHLDSEEFDLVAGSSMGGLAAANASAILRASGVAVISTWNGYEVEQFERVADFVGMNIGGYALFFQVLPSKDSNYTGGLE